MAMIDLLGQALGLVGNVAGSYMERKAEEQKAKGQIAKKMATAEIDWEQQMAKNAGNGWLDEFYGVCLFIPIALCFIPGYAPVVKEGFLAISESVPEWYIGAWLTAVAAAFGVRGLAKMKTKK